MDQHLKNVLGEYAFQLIMANKIIEELKAENTELKAKNDAN